MQDEWLRSVVKVGDGRGFVIEAGSERFIVTAGHCLPHLPPSHAASLTGERTYASLIGALGAEPTVWAECAFVDPVADLAVLCSPDGQAFFSESEDYEAFVANATPLPIGRLALTRSSCTLPGGFTFRGPPRVESEAWLLSLDERWFSCKVTSSGRGVWVQSATEEIRGGMSGSPIVTSDGAAIGVICASSSRDGPSAELWFQLPAWLVRTATEAN